jgi:hypothetical protein
MLRAVIMEEMPERALHKASARLITRPMPRVEFE